MKLTLQPLVENAIYHGLEPKREIGNLTISASLKNDFVEIIIQDDGVGIPPEQLALLQLPLNSSNPNTTECPDTHIGIFNVNRRLQLRFGPSSRIDISSKLGEGTCVRIKIPVSNPL